MTYPYRPDINGLRGLAALFVLFFHLDFLSVFNLFSGGYLGVDIFFVISGYVITLVIVYELKKKESFSILNFYIKRIKRIFPVLFFTLITSIFFAWLLLTPVKLIDFANSSISSALFLSNYVYYFAGQEYNNALSLSKPFLHTWTLSVEIQFYLIFPLVFIFLYKFNKKLLILILTLLSLLSLLFFYIYSQDNKSLAFFSFQSRFWQFSVGSLLYLFRLKYERGFQKNNNLNNLFSLFGFLIVIITTIFNNHLNLLYSFDLFSHSVLIVIGSAFVIFNHDNKIILTKFLSNKLLVFIGLISYSIYIWHYPVLIFSKLFYIKNIYFILIFIILISTISYLTLELPAKKMNNRKLLLVLALFFSIIIFANSTFIKNDGYKNRYPEIMFKNFDEKTYDLLKNNDGTICHQLIEPCVFNPSSKNTVFLIGDSLAASLSFDLEKKLTQNDFKFISFTGCNYFPDFNRFDLRNNRIDKQCNTDYFDKINEKISEEESSIIIIFGAFTQHFKRTNFVDNKEVSNKDAFKYITNKKYNDITESFLKNIKKISENNKVILVYPLPEPSFNVPAFLIHNIKNSNANDLRKIFNKNNYFSISYTDFKRRNEITYKIFDKLNNKNIDKVFLESIFCNIINQNECLLHNDKDIFYSDEIHPSIKGSELINNLIIEKVLNLTQKTH